MNKKILITGGLGHIGSALLEKLVRMGYDITVVDNLLTQRYCSLFDTNQPIKFLDKCISELTLLELKPFDIVIHLAAITNAAGSFTNKEQTENINLELTDEFIHKCDTAECKFIFPSSTSVYGTSAAIVYEDDESFLNPQSPYAETKIGIEKKLKGYESGYLILRFGTIFGTSIGMRFHTAINSFCYEASLSKPLTVWKENYNQYRPYLGLNDAIKSIIFFLESDSNWDETYNVLTGNYRLSEIVEYIKTKIDVTIDMVDTPLLNQFSYEVSDNKIKAVGFNSEDNLFNEIDKTLYKLRNLNNNLKFD